MRKCDHFTFRTYDTLLNVQTKAIDELLKRHKTNYAQKLFIINCYQTYYILTGKYLEKEEDREWVEKLTELFKVFYNKYKDLAKNIDDDMMKKVKEGAKVNALRQAYYKENDMSYEDFVANLV